MQRKATPDATRESGQRTQRPARHTLRAPPRGPMRHLARAALPQAKKFLRLTHLLDKPVPGWAQLSFLKGGLVLRKSFLYLALDSGFLMAISSYRCCIGLLPD